MVKAEKATHTLAAENRGAGTCGTDDFDEFIAKSLRVACAVIVDHEFREGTAQLPLTKRDEAVKALPLDLSNKLGHGRNQKSGLCCRERAAAAPRSFS